MKKILVPVTVLMLIFSCANSQIIQTENEKTGAQDVIDYYSGEVRSVKGVDVTNTNGRKRYYQLTLSKSQNVENFLGELKMISSYAACIFYQDLKEESKNFDEIRIVFIPKSGEKESYAWPIQTLALFSKEIAFGNRVAGLIKDKKYEELKQLLTPNKTLFPINHDDFISKLKQYDLTCGDVKEFLPQGFKFTTQAGKGQYLELRGFMSCEKQSHNLRLIIDPKSTKEEIEFLNYSTD